MTAATRAQIVAEALSWLGTPYHHEAEVRGAGVDCAMFIKAVMAEVGLIHPFTVEHYPSDWMQHRNEERFIAIVEQHARRRLDLTAETPLPGDVLVYQFGRCFAHGAIVVDWPVIVHASSLEREVGLAGARDGWLSDAPMRAYSMFGA